MGVGDARFLECSNLSPAYIHAFRVQESNMQGRFYEGMKENSKILYMKYVDSTLVHDS